jgi:hypothetical protein
MKNKFLFIGVIMLMFSVSIIAQNNVGIGTTSPHASAVLDLNASDKGLLIPRVNLVALNNGTSPISSPATGLLVYNQGGSVAVGFYYWDGDEWILVGSGGSVAGCTTLDEAYDCNGAGAGRVITADAGSVEIVSTNEFKPLLVTNSGANTFVISAEHTNTGVSIAAGSTNAANTYSTIQATTNSSSNIASAILGSSTGLAYGVTGQIEATGTSSAGVNGNNLRTSGGHGVFGMGVNGVVGQTNYLQGYGVYGMNTGALGDGDGPGVYGLGQTGVFGQTQNGAFFGVYGENISTSTTENNVGVAGLGWVGVFGQDDGTGYGVYSNGELGSSGTKSFVIDHPLDPENKTLKHFCAESPEVLNIYRGNVILNENGEATIELPEYFSEININFSYYLTPIGGAAPQLHVKEEVSGNSFVIGGGTANLKVSWVLYAERNDKYIQQNPNSKQVEVDKRQKGTYIRPELFGQPDNKGMFYKEKHNMQSLEVKEQKALPILK